MVAGGASGSIASADPSRHRRVCVEASGTAPGAVISDTLSFIVRLCGHRCCSGSGGGGDGAGGDGGGGGDGGFAVRVG